MNKKNHFQPEINDINRDVSSWKTLGKLSPYLLKHKFLLSCSIILLIASAFADTSLIAMLRPLLDLGFAENNHNFLLNAPFYIFALVLLRGVANYCYSFLLTFVSSKIIMDIRQKLFCHFLGLYMTLIKLLHHHQML